MGAIVKSNWAYAKTIGETEKRRSCWRALREDQKPFFPFLTFSLQKAVLPSKIGKVRFHFASLSWKLIATNSSPQQRHNQLTFTIKFFITSCASDLINL
ncbi:hypothetical protein L6452_29471 [Arctium lappa]|uniref:Uncharacterized protein n=1 Tax=Arctium lappa TaxID=4217 RepID=A0ACB8ZGZ2_ARCLA|nr:hypothetical protein L6452_29471 [Arctium lappa]